MKNLILFEDYKYLNKGNFNKNFDIEDGWVLKMPLNKKETPYKYKTTKEIISDFKRHIRFMSKFPEFFAKVKLLSSNRAAQEKLDTVTALLELKHISRIFRESKYPLKSLTTQDDFVKYIYQNDPERREISFLKDYIDQNSEDIVAFKWYQFLYGLIDKFSPMPLDIHADNFGIDKEGNIKLLDF